MILTDQRGAVVKAIAICTRHPFLHIYKVLYCETALMEAFTGPRTGRILQFAHRRHARPPLFLPK